MCTVIGYKSLKIDESIIHKALQATLSRGPDDERVQKVGCGFLGFQRLSIMGLDESGMQPFEFKGNYVVCNGEIYSLYKMDIHSIQKVTARFFCHSMKSMV